VVFGLLFAWAGFSAGDELGGVISMAAFGSLSVVFGFCGVRTSGRRFERTSVSKSHIGASRKTRSKPLESALGQVGGTHVWRSSCNGATADRSA
jgi:hypothetical protein